MISFAALSAASVVQPANKPNIFMILADDYGWADAGWHNNVTTAGQKEVQTPNMQQLIAEGIELNQHYVFKFCSPTRSAIQSGRNPIHVNVQNVNPNYYNKADPVAGFSAIPRNMTGMAEHLRDAGYSTAMVGKWDAGMATQDHTPKGRGYEQSLIYFHHANDYWTYGVGGNCYKLAHQLRNETDQGWDESPGSYFQGFRNPEQPESDACPANFTIRTKTGMCTQAEYSRNRHVNSQAECCSWCATTDFGKNGSCVGWTYHSDSGACFNCFKTKPASGPKDVNRTSGCIDAACNGDTGHLIRDLWEDAGPASAKADAASPQPECKVISAAQPWPADGGGAVAPGAGCKYEDELFEEKVHAVLAGHNASDQDRPLFLFWAPHIVHGPAQVPKDAFELLNFIQGSAAGDTKTHARQIYLARVRYIDAAIGRLVTRVKAKGMWENSLFVFSSDNGGPLGSANNYPLKGGKHSNWQGGVRVNAWVSGGLVPPSRRGTKLDSIVCGWDWYATFAFLAGVDPTDHKAAEAGLPPIDSINQWPAITGQAATPIASPRVEVPLGSCTDADSGHDVFCQSKGRQQTTVNGVVAYLDGNLTLRAPKSTHTRAGVDSAAADAAPLVPHLYKLLVGEHIPLASWSGPQAPNGTAHGDANLEHNCGVAPSGTGCVYDLTVDPTEHHDLMADMSSLATEDQARLLIIHDVLWKKIQTHNATTFTPNRGEIDDDGSCAAVLSNKGYWGPWIE